MGKKAELGASVEQVEDVGSESNHGDEWQIAQDVTSARPSAFTKHMLCLYLVLFPSYLCSCLNGYDGSLMSSINAMPPYLKFFNMKNVGSSTGITFAIYNVGGIAATPLAGPASDMFGRKWATFIGCMFVIVGTCVQAPSQSSGAFLGGRFLLGLGAQFTAISSPTYASEMAHPYWRGTLSGLYNVSWYVGSIIASWTCYGTAFIDGQNAFRIPIWCQLITSGIVIMALYFMPESPRWLMAQGRIEDAKKVLTFYHGEGDENNVFVKMQLAEMGHQIETSGADKRWWDYRDLFRTKAARSRMWCVIGMGWFGQYTGNAVVSYFFPTMMEAAGISDSHTQLLLNSLQPVFSLIAAVCGALLTDKMGRRPPLMGASFFGSVCFAIMTGCTKVASTNKVASVISIVFTYLFMITFSFAYTPLQALYIVECLPTETRAKGNAVGGLVSSIASLVGQYIAATAMANIGYKYYLFFVFWDLFEVTIIYFFFVETKNRTLEELNEVFNSPHPVKKSLEKRDATDIVLAINKSSKFVSE